MWFKYPVLFNWRSHNMKWWGTGKARGKTKDLEERKSSWNIAIFVKLWVIWVSSDLAVKPWSQSPNKRSLRTSKVNKTKRKPFMMHNTTLNLNSPLGCLPIAFKRNLEQKRMTKTRATFQLCWILAFILAFIGKSFHLCFSLCWTLHHPVQNLLCSAFVSLFLLQQKLSLR